MSLREYNKKRDFSKTNEPMGKSKKSGKQKIFAVQYHSATRNHFDLRLEYNGSLLSWAVPKGFSYSTKVRRLAIRVEDHPLDYSDFEGVIPKGQYGAGPVMLWDTGSYIPLSNFREGLNNGVLKFELFGEKLRGKWALIKTNMENNSWLLIKDKDEYSNSATTLSMTSVKTGRTIDEIRGTISKNPFSKINIQLATLTKDIPNTKDWLFEIKYDGYRIVSFLEDDEVKLLSRNGNSYSEKFKDITDSLKLISQEINCVLDGEVVKLDEAGKSNFQLLQSHIKSKENNGLVYMVFDILALNGEDLRNKPLSERKEILNKFFKNIEKYNINNIKNVDFMIGNGKNCFNAVQEQGLEGIIAKKINSKYLGKRSDDWLKIKCINLQEFIIIGYTTSDKRKHFSSLLLATREENNLIFIGKVGTGFNEENSQELMEKFKPLKTNNCPVSPLPTKAKVQWLKPKLVANIQYLEITRDGLLRQASFKGLRDDKSADIIVLEKPKENLNDDKINFKITNPNKVVFPEKNITKLDIINYYKSVSKRMMKYVSNRILSVVRCHGGVGANCFYKKHPKSNPYVNKINVDEHEYFYINNLDALLYEAQLGTIEFHIWGSQIDTINSPDIMVFDLDPDEKLDLADIRQGVKDLRKILTSLKLRSYLKTSGGKGYHVVVPINTDFNWKEFSNFSEKIAILLEAKYPDRYTTNIRKNKRTGKIFIDYLRNSKSATSVCPYSLRSRAGASVSMPIAWSELDKIAPNEIDINEAVKRLKKRDPWKDFPL